MISATARYMHSFSSDSLMEIDHIVRTRVNLFRTHRFGRYRANEPSDDVVSGRYRRAGALGNYAGNSDHDCTDLPSVYWVDRKMYLYVLYYVAFPACYL